MVTHSSILAWKIPSTEEPGRRQSMSSQRARHSWRDWALHSTFIAKVEASGCTDSRIIAKINKAKTDMEAQSQSLTEKSSEESEKILVQEMMFVNLSWVQILQLLLLLLTTFKNDPHVSFFEDQEKFPMKDLPLAALIILFCKRGGLLSHSQVQSFALCLCLAEKVINSIMYQIWNISFSQFSNEKNLN